MIGGAIRPIEGARAIERLNRDFDHPPALRAFCEGVDYWEYLAEEYPERIPEFDGKLIESARRLLGV
jgi:hypothetical protein